MSRSVGVVFLTTLKANEIIGLSKIINADNLDIESSKLTLYKDEELKCNLNLKSSNVNLNGWTLTILNNLNQTNGTLDIKGGKLIVGNDLIQADATIKINGGELTVVKDYKITGASLLEMINEKDYILVKGNFETKSSKNEEGYLTAGILEIKGTVTQESNNQEYWSPLNFCQSGTFRLVLSGEEEQRVSLTDYSRSQFNILDMSRSVGILFLTGLKANEIIDLSKIRNTDTLTINKSKLTLYKDEELKCSLNLTDSNVNLNEHTLTVLNSINQANSTIDINRGRLIVGGSLAQTRGEIVLNGGELIIGNDYTIANSSRLEMKNEKDYILVKGNFQTTSYNDEKGYLTAGTLEIKGDVTQKHIEPFVTSNFYQSGIFRLVLSGEKVQKVTIENYSASPFNILDMSRSVGVLFLTTLKANEIIGLSKIVNTDNLNIESSTLNLYKDEELRCNLNLKLSNVKLNGYTLTVINNLNQIDGTIDINSGKLVVGSNLNQAGGKIVLNGGLIIVANNYTITESSYLIMTNNRDYILVKGNFETNSERSEEGYLAAGTLEIKGDFRQSGSSYSFAASGNHTVILSGSRVQTVYFSNSISSGFKDLIVTNPYGMVYGDNLTITILTLLGNFFLGVKDGADSAATDLVDIVTNPSKIVDGVQFLLQCLTSEDERAQVLKLIADSIVDTISKLADSDGNTRARMVGKFVGEVIVGLIADKAVMDVLKYLKEGFLVKINNKLVNGEGLGGYKTYADDIAEGASNPIDELIEKGKKIIKFDNPEDPFRDVFGSGSVSNLEEWSKLISELEANGVEVVYREGALGYGPLIKGEPGQILIDPNASMSALRHEYSHFLEAKANGFPSAAESYQNWEARIADELKAYNIEIEEAKRLGLDNVAEQLQKNFEAEKQYIIERFGPIE